MAHRNRVAGVLAGLALLGALGLGVGRNRRSSAQSQDPQATVYAMLDAARSGEVARYLDHFAAPAIDEFRQQIRESGESAFAKYLREANARIEGIAVTEPEIAGNAAVIRVEYVYSDRTVTQQLSLTKQADRWRIERADGEERTSMPVPFGTVLK